MQQLHESISESCFGAIPNEGGSEIHFKGLLNQIKFS